LWFMQLTCSACLAVSAHADAYMINSTNGLSNNGVNSIFQDSRGFIWFGTDDGLNRYDGYEYVVFRHDIFDTLSIASGQIYDIEEDDLGNMWIATNRGVSKLDIGSNSFINLKFYPVTLSIDVNETFDLAFGRDGVLWCLLRETIISYNIHTGQLYEYDLRNSSGEVPLISRRSNLHYDAAHDMLLIGTSNGLYYLDEHSGEFLATPLKPAFIYDIFLDRNGELWLGSSLGLSRCNWKPGSDVPADCRQVYTEKPVRGIASLADDRMVLATRNSSLLFDVTTGEVVAEPYIELASASDLPGVRTILLDRMLNLWIGTFGGVCHADLHPYRFAWFNSGSETVRLDRDMISSVCRSDHQLYLGSWRGGLQVIDLKTMKKEFLTKNDPGNGYADGGVNVIRKDLKGRIWVLSEHAYFFDRASSHFTRVEELLDIPGMEIEGSRIYDIAFIDSVSMVIAHSDGFYYINEQTGVFRNTGSLTADSLSIPLEDVTSVEVDHGVVWFGTASGLVRHDLVSGQNAFYQVGIDNGLNDRVLTMKLDSRGWLWLGSPSGLYRLKEEEGTFSGYSVQLGFANDYIYSIEEDHAGRLWMGTNQGIISLDPASGEVGNYGMQHGLSSMEFNINASDHAADGTMYFGGINGVNFFHPDSVRRSEQLPPIMITGVRYFSAEGDRYEPFAPQVLYIRDIESVQLFFSLLDYDTPGYNLFRYRLIDASGQGQWNNIGKDNSLILSGLEHGAYTFEVQGSDDNGQWSNAIATVELQVSAPFYRRKLFTWLMFLPLLFLVFFIFEFRTKTLKKSNRALREKEIAAREVLRQKNLLSRRNRNIEDSLKYAQRIQYAMFTSELEIRKMFSESFIFQKPKDIVSGDFYWARKIDTRVFLAAVDCTGHGVPGAFMSLIGLEFFRQIIDTKGVYQPARVLNEINKNFDLIFGNMDELNMRDGMDMTFCMIDTVTNQLQYAGAFNPLYIVRKGEIIEIKADKYLLGPNLGYGRAPFTNHEFQLEKDDIVYMFSDGYADQFGGPEGKKFKYRRFRHLLLSVYNQPMHIQKQILENSINEWRGSHEQVDDILVMGVKPVS